ncbi:hypothetical protein HS088_TW09G01389 [Tripterygium wilfordii]|uniref:Uncharacterized protein n=1 Tax=Tripterygium wilfordii TaxID=458696 RepID=A0A7J7DAE2_TRIWF|nr:hypothetical protein HS088_TW09G01389 [Tripterygium wilfordii]
MEVPALLESRHSFSLYFLVPGEYTIVAAAVIDDANDILRARARTDSPDEPIFFGGLHSMSVLMELCEFSCNLCLS